MNYIKELENLQKQYNEELKIVVESISSAMADNPQHIGAIQVLKQRKNFLSGEIFGIQKALDLYRVL